MPIERCSRPGTPLQGPLRRHGACSHATWIAPGVESGLAAALVDVVDGLVDGCDLLGVLIRDFDLVFLLEGHDQLDLGADSLDTVELVMALEEEFEIEIPDEDAEKITTVHQAIDYINERRSKS